MKRINETEITPTRILGTKGFASAFDVLTGVPTMGVRVVAPDSEVPKPPHKHPEKQVIYVISGSATITNGEETLALVPGDFVLLEANEEHYVSTEKDEVKVFEIKY